MIFRRCVCGLRRSCLQTLTSWPRWSIERSAAFTIGDRDNAVMRGQSVRLAGAAALGEQLQFGTEHVAFRNLQDLALGVAVLAALDIQRRVWCSLHGVSQVPKSIS